MKRLCFVLLIFFPLGLLAQEVDDVEFNQDFLGDSGQQITTDLQRFKQKNTLLPGVYLSDIYVNGKWIGRQDLTFEDDTELHRAQTCINQSLLQLFGVDINILPEEIQAILQQHQCHALASLVPGAHLDYDANALRADISIPQYYLLKNARGYIHPKLWDEGVPAATIGYQFNTYRYQSVGLAENTYYLGLNNGVNIAGWRLRNQSVMTKSDHHAGHYQQISTYAKHDVTAIHGQLLIGDTYTSSSLFESIGFRGIQLASDDRMLPDSLVGYAPVVRGVAKTNAKVSIYQQSLLIYETNVSPGAFEINDLYATGQSGDLQVIVTEANGEQYQYVVPNMSFSPLLREGATKYAITLGKTRETGVGLTSSLLQVEGGIGLHNALTVYGGVLLARHYQSLASSLALSTPYGAIAVGMNDAKAMINHQKNHGQSFNVKYSHQLAETETTLSLAAYHYFSPHYYFLSDVLEDQSNQTLTTNRNADSMTWDASSVGQQHQLQFNISQYLGENNGTIFLSGSVQRYWHQTQTKSQYLIGYGNSYQDITYQLTLQRQKSVRTNKMNTQFALSLSFPLGKKVNAPTMSVNHYQTDASMTSVAVNGTIDKENTWSYGASASKSDEHYNAAVSSQYRAPYALLNGAYSRGYHYSQISGNVSGGIVLHPGGVTLAQSLGESIGIVEATGATGAKVNHNGISVDRFGYAIVPFLTPYRMNQVELDPKGISFDVELSTTSQRVTPRAGAVVMLKYPTLTGRSALFMTTIDHQFDMPFGAEVFDEQHHYVGMTGQGGHVFVRGLETDQGVLTVKWGSHADDQCYLPYQLPEKADQEDDELLQIEATCFKYYPDAPAYDNAATVN